MTVDIFGLNVKRVLIRDGAVVEGLPGYKPKWDGITQCYFCGKLLTDALSKARGVGSDCHETKGLMPNRESVEEHAKQFSRHLASRKRAGKASIPYDEWLQGLKAEDTLKIWGFDDNHG